MEQLVYISTSRSDPPGAVELEDILAASRRNNARDGLSGLLVVGGRRFLQVLEGPTDALAQAYERIKRDPRHFAMVELTRKSIAERSFPDWAMGFEVGDGDLSTIVDRMTSTVQDASLQAQLRSFAELHSKAA